MQQDVGGVTREVFMLFTEAFFSSAVGLFVRANCDEVCYTIDPHSGTAPETLEFYRFAGRVFGKGFIDGHNLAARLTVPLLKQLLRLPLVQEDLRFVEPEIHNSLTWMAHSSIEGVLEETFTVTMPGMNTDQVLALALMNLFSGSRVGLWRCGTCCDR